MKSLLKDSVKSGVAAGVAGATAFIVARGFMVAWDYVENKVLQKKKKRTETKEGEA